MTPETHNSTAKIRAIEHEHEQLLSKQGLMMVNQLCIFLKTAKLYNPDNNSYISHLRSLNDFLQASLAESDELTIQLQSGYLFYCSVRVRTEYDENSNAAQLMALFQQLALSGLMFTRGVTAGNLVDMAEILNGFEGDHSHAYDELRRSFALRNIDSIELLPPIYESMGETGDINVKRQTAKRSFFSAVGNLKGVMSNIAANRKVDLSRTLRIVHSLVDQVVADERYLLELTALRAHDEYTFVHSTNVCVYAICLGASLGLNKAELATLGFGALFHDIGKTKLPLEILNKPSDFSQSEWELMRKHPTYGVLAIAKTMPFDESSCRAMLVAFEHHFNLDGTGYPLVRFRRDLNLHSRIVAICDVFDALTSGRVYRRNPLSPEMVLRQMLKQAGTKFDPLLLKCFIRTVSLYPPGSILLLDNQTIGLVIAPNRTDLLRPVVKVIGNLEGLFEIADEVDLSEHDTEGHYARNIVRVVNPEELPVNLSHYVLQTFA